MADFTPVAQSLKAYIDTLVDEKLAAQPQPEPEPEPQPEEPKTYLDEVAFIYWPDNADWKNGTLAANSAVFVAEKHSPDYLVVGAVVETATGRELQIVSVNSTSTSSRVHATLSDKLNPDTEGYPNTLKVVSSPAVVQPDPTFMRRSRGRVCLNVGMGAGGDSAIPGIESTNYTMTKASELDRAKAMGITEIRVGYLEGRIFKRPDSTEYWQGNDVTQPTWGRVMTLDHLWRIGEEMADRGMSAMLDNHTYGYFPSNGAATKHLLGSAENTVDMWVERCYKLLELLKSNEKAWSAIKRFDVINEPYMSAHNATFLAAAYQKLLDRCAPLTGTDLVFVFEGPSYSSMSRWAELVGDAFDNLTHPHGRQYIEFSAHGYLDRGKDGYFDENKDGKINSADEVLATGETWETLHLSRAQNFVEWLKAKNFNGNVGETIVPGNLPQFVAAEERLITYLCDNGVDVFVFGLADGMDAESEHNIETTFEKSGGVVDMTAMLELTKRLASKYNA